MRDAGSENCLTDGRGDRGGGNRDFGSSPEDRRTGGPGSRDSETGDRGILDTCAPLAFAEVPAREAVLRVLRGTSENVARNAPRPQFPSLLGQDSPEPQRRLGHQSRLGIEVRDEAYSRRVPGRD